MEAISLATEIVRKAECDLRQLLLKSAEGGEYEAASQLADWANQLKQIINSHGALVRQSLLVNTTTARRKTSSAAEGALGDSPHRSADEGPRRARRKTRRKAARGEYPKFFRDGDELLKIGWSKRTWATYRHKAPKQLVDLMAQALLDKGKSGERFSMEEILPLHDPKGASEVPSYQAYLSLAWLRKEGLVVQHGREGYSLRPGSNLLTAIGERWKRLPKS